MSRLKSSKSCTFPQVFTSRRSAYYQQACNKGQAAASDKITEKQRICIKYMKHFKSGLHLTRT